MGFEINQDRDPATRQILSARDREYLKNCETCSVAQVCGPSWSIWNDARWCDGPGDVCFDGCRAICSKNSDKVDRYAKLLGPDGFEMRTDPDGDERAKPDLSIVGKHPWEPWTMDWPDVGFQLNTHADGAYQPLYTVSLKHLFYWQRGSWSPKYDLRKRFKIPANSRLAITTTCNDRLMDALELRLGDVGDLLAAYEPDFVFAPNFSIYDNYPRMDQLFRAKFRWVGLERMQEAGLRVVPSVCFITSLDFRNQTAWMRENRCDVMLMNFQTQAVTTQTAMWNAYIKSACAVRDALGWPVQLIAYGAAGDTRLKSVVDNYGPNVTFIDAKSYRLAEYHKDIAGNVHPDVPVKDLVQRNFRDRRVQVAVAKGRDPYPNLDFTGQLSLDPKEGP